jgi:hypothetical protein
MILFKHLQQKRLKWPEMHIKKERAFLRVKASLIFVEVTLMSNLIQELHTHIKDSEMHGITRLTVQKKRPDNVTVMIEIEQMIDLYSLRLTMEDLPFDPILSSLHNEFMNTETGSKWISIHDMYHYTGDLDLILIHDRLERFSRFAEMTFTHKCIPLYDVIDWC